MSTLPGEDSHPTLLFYIFGDQSVTLSRALAALKSQKEKQEHLVTAFKPYFSRLPHYVKGGAHCAPVSCLATNWVADEYAGFGSYSTFRTGLKQCDKDIEIMREGLPGRGVWFAGEHTGPFIALGTCTSAYVRFHSQFLFFGPCHTFIIGNLLTLCFFSGAVNMSHRDSHLLMT